MFSVKLALTVLLTAGSLTAALPDHPPPSYQSKHHEKCHMSYTTKVFTTSKPYPTVLYRYETTRVPVTEHKKRKHIITVVHTHTSLETSVKKTTEPAVYTKEHKTTKKVEKSWHCPATTHKLKTRTKTSTWTKRYPTSVAAVITVKKTYTHTLTGVRTKTKESVYKTWDTITKTTESTCTETSTVKETVTSNSLKTKTYTSIWTEVETVPVVQTKTVTKKHIYTTTKPIVTSTKCAVTTHLTKKLPWTHTSVGYHMVTSTTYRHTYGTHTETRTILSTVKVPEVYRSTCSSHTKEIRTIPVVHTSSKVRKIKETHKVPCTDTKLETKITHVPHVYHTKSVIKTSCTETAYKTVKTTKVLSHKVCSQTKAPTHYSV